MAWPDGWAEGREHIEVVKYQLEPGPALGSGAVSGAVTGLGSEQSVVLGPHAGSDRGLGQL